MEIVSFILNNKKILKNNEQKRTDSNFKSDFKYQTKKTQSLHWKVFNVKQCFMVMKLSK